MTTYSEVFSTCGDFCYPSHLGSYFCVSKSSVQVVVCSYVYMSILFMRIIIDSRLVGLHFSNPSTVMFVDTFNLWYHFVANYQL